LATQQVPAGDVVEGRLWLRLAVVALAYYASAEVGLRLALVGNDVTPLWPPTGIALVALLLWGRRVWPAIAVAALAVNLPISPNAGAAVVIAAGNTIAPLLAAFLLVRVNFRSQLDRVRDALALVFLAALFPMAVSATIGSVTLLASDAISSHNFAGAWTVWWTGDAMGVLIFAPFIWWLLALRRSHVSSRQVADATLLALLLACTCAIALMSEVQLVFLIPPIVGAIAWRFEQRGAAPAALAVSVAVTIAAANEIGPFVDRSLVDRMIALQSFNATVALTSLFVAAAVAEQQRLANREHYVAETLQLSLLPTRIPDFVDLGIAARYVPAGTDVAVGGDWYDVIPLPQGRFGLVVGDVAGHGVRAAAAMGQIRMAVRAYAFEDLSPGDALSRLNALLRDVQPAAMTTVWFGHYDTRDATLTFANAGHPPPLLLDGEARFLEEANGPPLGAAAQPQYPDVQLRLAPGNTLIVYTDGLVEQRDQSIDHGMRLLRERAVVAPENLEQLCDHIVAQPPVGGHRDDVAVLAFRPLSLAGRELRVRKPASPSSVPDIRRVLRAWLEQNDVPADTAVEVLVAATEAYTNAVQHAYGLVQGDIEIDARLVDGNLELIVRDHGSWRVWKPHPLGNGGHGGHGISVMRAMMDTVEIDLTERGTEVRMRRRVSVPVSRS
jgi:integral membrane sensor domain MASE1/anti-sigma regulatory factor (Ser/Thr protein kinase)